MVLRWFRRQHGADRYVQGEQSFRNQRTDGVQFECMYFKLPFSRVLFQPHRLLPHTERSRRSSSLSGGVLATCCTSFCRAHERRVFAVQDLF